MHRALTLAAILFLVAGCAVLALAWRWNEERFHQGPVEFRLDATHGLHRMDVRLLALVGTLWLTALMIWSIGRKSGADR
jgi:hypothetical protein